MEPEAEEAVPERPVGERDDRTTGRRLAPELVDARAARDHRVEEAESMEDVLSGRPK